MLRSVLLVVDAACISRVIARAAQLPLAVDAEVTLVEVFRSSAGDRSPVELHSLVLLARCRRIRCTSVEALDLTALRELVLSSRPDLVVVGDIRFLGWHASRLLRLAPVLFVRASRIEPYQRPVVAIQPCGADAVLHTMRRVLPSSCAVTRGDTHSVLSNAASSARADLVVVGRRARTTISRLLFGSVSRWVLRDVTCDVLTVPISTSASP